MDELRLRCWMHKEGEATLRPKFHDLIERSPLSERVCRHDLGPGRMDMQGIQWDSIGCERRVALSARVLVHPSREYDATQPLDLLQNNPESERYIEETAYRFDSFTPIHKPVIGHFQLRNVLTATDRSNIFYAAENMIHRASLDCPLSQETVLDLFRSIDNALNIYITCLSSYISPSNHNTFLLAGGTEGEYALLRLNNDTNTTSLDAEPLQYAQGYILPGDHHVNHIHNFPHRRSGVPHAAFCGNDSTFRLMDLTTCTTTATFRSTGRVNCAATSPDGRMRVLMLDSHDALVTDAEHGGSLATLSGHESHGFACAWSPHGTYVATGAEDGKTLVWDARSWARPLATLPSVMSCPRSLQFTEDGSLIVAEDEDVVSIYAAAGGGGGGMFEKKQDIRFFGSIAGMAVLEGGRELIVGNVDSTVGGMMMFTRTARSGDEDKLDGQKKEGEEEEGVRPRRRHKVEWRSVL